MGSAESRLQQHFLDSIEGREDMQVKELLEAHPEYVNTPLCNGSTNGICRATFLGYKNIVNLLLKYGADINLKSSNGRSPLIWAAYREHLDLIDLLLESGADTSIRDEDGLDAFEVAVVQVNYKAARMLYKKANMITPLEERKEKFVDPAGTVVGKYYRSRFDVELFFDYLEADVEEVDRDTLYDKIRKEKEEWYAKDLVVDVRESWSQWGQRQVNFTEAPLIPREELPQEFQPHRSFYGKLACFANGIDPYPQEVRRSRTHHDIEGGVELRERKDQQVLPMDQDDSEEMPEDDKSRTLVNETINVSKIDLMIDQQIGRGKAEEASDEVHVADNSVGEHEAEVQYE